jgi:hypothetical protein
MTQKHLFENCFTENESLMYLIICYNILQVKLMQLYIFRFVYCRINMEHRINISCIK